MATRNTKRPRVVRDEKEEEASNVAIPQHQQTTTTSREGSQADSCTGSNSGKSARAGGSSSAQAARREQNRISQEKSRNKRDERMSLLEAKVRLQSYSDSAQSIVLLKTISVILRENTRLREMLGQCSSFIGQGHGGELAGFGVSRQALQEAVDTDNMQFLTKASMGLKEVADYFQTQTAASAFGNASGSDGDPSHTVTGTSPVLASAPLAKDSPSPWAIPQDGPSSFTSSKSRSTTIQPEFLTTMTGAGVHAEAHPPVKPTEDLPAFIDRLLAQPLQNSNQAPSSTDYLLSDYLNPDVLCTPKSSAQDLTIPAPLRHNPKTSVCQLATQAAQLMEYHIGLKHQNASYKLPASLEKTLLQKSVSYDTCIDRVIWPSMRDKLISRQYEQLSQAATASLDSVQCIVNDLWSSLTVHPCKDLLDVQAWELSEDFLLKYPTLVDVGMLQTCNKWRMTRNATIIVL